MRTSSQYKYKFVSQEFVDKEGYLSLEEDIMARGVKEASFIVMNHHPDDRLKTEVQYYTHRKRSSYTSHEGNPEGSEWVYVLVHPQEPELLKIGYTSKEPTQRLKEINSQTGVAGEYRMVYIYRTVNGQRLETAVHSFLKDKRINPRKEHFQINREEVIQVIKEMGLQYG
jgi:hypothetical protein